MAKRKTAGKSKELAPALSRGIRILNLVAEQRRNLTSTDICNELGLAKSSVHGLCAALVNEGLLERSPEGLYRLGLRLVDLAHARLGGSELSEEFHSLWASQDAFQEDASVLSIRDESDMVYIACRNSSMPLGVQFRIGMRLPASCTATGKAVLSTLREEEVADLYEGRTFEHPTRKSVQNLRDLLKQLKQIRSRGFSLDDGETRERMCSFGAPVFSVGSDQAVAGIAISMFREDLTKAKRIQAADFVQQLANDLSKTQGRIDKVP